MQTIKSLLMGKKLTQKQFEYKANKIHDNKYSYLEYLGYSHRMGIICPIHGMFKQVAGDHLKKQGCKKCGIEKEIKRKTVGTKKFIKKARKIHGNKYDYSLVEYVKNSIKIKIICPIHGMFEQSPASHLKTGGCKKCSHDALCSNANIFIKKANKIHDNKYDYSLVEYINNTIKVKIICPIHGIFNQTPSNHLNNFGCSFCGGTRTFTKTQFIKKARKIHGNKYDYSLVEYKNIFTKIVIICPKHGNFEQTPHDHLSEKGCRKCVNITTKSQVVLKQELQKLLINQKIILEKSIKLTETNRTVHADIFIPEKKIIIEYNGDYWHCNPVRYQENYLHPHNNLTAKEIWLRDLTRKQELEKLGYKVFIVWENDFKKNKEDVIMNLVKNIKEHD